MSDTMSRQDVLKKVYKMIPPMLEKFHKGKVVHAILEASLTSQASLDVWQ